MLVVKFSPDGQTQFIWNDKLKDLFNEGTGAIRRASHVEPTPEGRWVADLAPVGGPVLEAKDTRAEALEAEVAWLEANIIGVCQ